MPLLEKGSPIYMQNGVTTSLVNLVDSYVVKLYGCLWCKM